MNTSMGILSSTSADTGIVSTRIFAAPRELLFEAFSNPGHLVHWWGPKGFTNTFHEFDLRPGGEWRFVMHGPDGAEYQIAKDFVEVVKPERIVLQNLEPTHRFLMTMTFADVPGGTRLTWLMLFESAEENEKLRSIISEANEQNFDRLAAYLEKISEIDKLAWLYIEEKRLLAARSKGKVAYYMPGGKRERGESDEEALTREIKEELSVDILPETIRYVGEFKAQADRKPDGMMVRMTCYEAGFRGEITAAAEIEEVAWISHKDKDRCSPVVKVILDWLKEKGMIE
jgi:uncharacterized protein YndB with AHSA1/START domain/ADP-ribose pyrophosphatase YjhB (NUDIX family)